VVFRSAAICYSAVSMKEKIFTVSESELSAFVFKCLSWLPKSEKAVVLALSGELGAGKTTFVKTLARELGVNEVVTSPTFTLMKSYETSNENWTHLIHMDAYRIEDLTELKPLRFEELLTKPGVLFCIEWANKIAPALPPDTIWMQFENTADDVVRTVRISGEAVNG